MNNLKFIAFIQYDVNLHVKEFSVHFNACVREEKFLDKLNWERFCLSH